MKRIKKNSYLENNLLVRNVTDEYWDDFHLDEMDEEKGTGYRNGEISCYQYRD